MILHLIPVHQPILNETIKENDVHVAIENVNSSRVHVNVRLPYVNVRLPGIQELPSGYIESYRKKHFAKTSLT